MKNWRAALKFASDGVARRLGCDLRVLALFRISIGILLITDVLMRATDIAAFYTDFGVLPVGAYITEFANKWHISLHLASGTIGWQILLFALSFVVGVAVLCGYRTRTAVIIAWVLLVSVQNRNTMILNGGDVLFRMLLFWSMFLPLGARWSVDAALAEPEPERKTGAAANLLFTGGTMGITMQVVYVYLSTSMLKDGREWWPEGTASFLALSLDSFVTSFGVWMRQWHEVLRYSTYAVWFFEISSSFLLFVPIFFVWSRLLTLAGMMFLHLNFDLAMRLGLFPWVDIALLIALIPGEAIDWLERRWATPERRGLVLVYDQDCGFCKRAVRLIREALLIRETTLEPASLTDTWIVRDAAGVEHTRWDAGVVVLEHSPLIGWVAKRLPLRLLTPLCDRLYNFIAKNRGTIGKGAARVLPWQAPGSLQPSLIGNLLAVFFVGYVGILVAKTIPDLNVSVAPPWDRVGSVLRLDQKWNMFAPYPLKEDGWYVIDGELADGTKVDVLARTVGAASYDKPPLVAYDKYENARWRKYLMNIWSKKRKGHRLYYGKYLCRSWNSELSDQTQKLKKFDIIFMKEYSNPPGEEPTLTRHSIWQHECF